MSKSSTLLQSKKLHSLVGGISFLKSVLILMAVVVLVGLLWFPQTEGRAKDLDLISIYLDPFIIYIYVASIPFFVALYQGFNLLGHIEQNKAFSQTSVNALRNIKYCAIAIVGFLLIAEAMIIWGGKDEDKAGVVMLGLILIFATSVVGTAAAVFQKLLQNAVDIKSENDLTV